MEKLLKKKLEKKNQTQSEVSFLAISHAIIEALTWYKRTELS